MLWNNETESLMGSEFYAFEKYENEEWVNIHLYYIDIISIGHYYEPYLEYVWGHTFPLEMLMPGHYRIWRETYREDIERHYASFYYSGSITTILSSTIFILLILASPLKLLYKVVSTLNFIFFNFLLVFLHWSHSKHISYYNPGGGSYEGFLVMFGLALFSLGIFDWISYRSWRREQNQ